MRALTKKVKSKAGRSMAWSSSTISSDVRSSFIDCMGRRWRRIVDNRMRDYGDIDFERHIIRINHAMHRRGTVPTPAASRPMRVRAAGKALAAPSGYYAKAAGRIRRTQAHAALTPEERDALTGKK
jgi:hypothetical protein